MAFGHGLDADFYFSGNEISDYIRELDVSFERDLAEMAHLGQDWQESLVGIRRLNASVDGDYDSVLDGYVWTAFDGSVATSCTYYPEGSGTGVKYEFDVRVPSFSPGPAGTDDAVRYSFDMVVDGSVTRSTV